MKVKYMKNKTEHRRNKRLHIPVYEKLHSGRHFERPLALDLYLGSAFKKDRVVRLFLVHLLSLPLLLPSASTI